LGSSSASVKRKLDVGVVHDIVCEGTTIEEPLSTIKLEDCKLKKLKLDPLQGILNFVYKEMQNPSIVDTDGFREMIMQVQLDNFAVEPQN